MLPRLLNVVPPPAPQVFFEANGVPRVVEVKEESKATAQLKKPSRDKADVSDPGECPPAFRPLPAAGAAVPVQCLW